MPVMEFITECPVPVEALFEWHDRPGAFERLSPPWEAVRVIERSGTIRDGDRLVMAMRVGPIPATWEARHEGWEAGCCFRDVMVRGPFARWRHDHLFESYAGGSRLTDRLDFALPLGPLGEAVAGGFTRNKLRRVFAFRGRRLLADLERQAEARARPAWKPWRIAVTGASGMVASALTAFLTTAGHTVIPFVRQRGRTGIFWNPDAGEVDRRALEGVDAVVHLAGAPIAGARWTPSRKQVILTSRQRSTAVLSQALADLTHRPQVLVSASGIGIYGDRGDEILTPESPAGVGFLAQVATAWEEATAPAAAAGIRVVIPRIGPVMSASGGMLRALRVPFLLGLGGPVGSGRQWLPWIALDDVVGLLHHLLWADEIHGPIHAVAPNPVTNAGFARNLGTVLHRPAFMPLPTFAVRLIFGEMGEELLLAGQRAAATDTGYRFRYSDLRAALEDELGR